VPEVGVSVDVVLKNSYSTSYSAFKQLNILSKVTVANVTYFDITFFRNSNSTFYSKWQIQHLELCHTLCGTRCTCSWLAFAYIETTAVRVALHSTPKLSIQDSNVQDKISLEVLQAIPQHEYWLAALLIGKKFRWKRITVQRKLRHQWNSAKHCVFTVLSCLIKSLVRTLTAINSKTFVREIFYRDICKKLSSCFISLQFLWRTYQKTIKCSRCTCYYHRKYYSHYDY
jgi:hypothetical protein